jgi:hypothetical protein
MQNKENNRGKFGNRQNNSYRDGSGQRGNNYFRDNGYSKQNYSNSNSRSNSGYNNHRMSNRVKAEETIDDIKADINRIEKEIDLELKEIKSLRIGI